ncbi:MAG: hypothetical protein HUJ65_07470, partial [Oscillospiraceae bacterium]|nr:hypothetical protein [Oscillospiraceae bacterium]
EQAGDKLAINGAIVSSATGEKVQGADFTDDYVTPEPSLPDTGLLWWPVPVLSVLGFMCIAAAIFGTRKAKDHD